MKVLRSNKETREIIGEGKTTIKFISTGSMYEHGVVLTCAYKGKKQSIEVHLSFEEMCEIGRDSWVQMATGARKFPRQIS